MSAIVHFINNECGWADGLTLHSRFSVLSSDPMAATDENLPQATPNDTQHSLRHFLKLGAGDRSGHLLRILGVGFGIAVGIGNTIGSGIFRTPWVRLRVTWGTVGLSLQFGSSEFTAILILLSYVASILIVREKSPNTPAKV